MKYLLHIDPLSLASIHKVIQDIDTYNRAWKVQTYLNIEQLQELRHLSTVQSTGSSTRIEGGRMSDEAIADLIDHMHIQSLSSRDEQEVAGYFTSLEIIQEQYRDLLLSESLIKALHNELLRYSSKDTHHRGQYKQLSNQVVATDAHGEQQIIFQTTDPALTPKAMETAVNWYLAERASKNQHPLILIGAFIYEFLSIHPFQDGNGRLSRLLTNLLLLQNGYEFVLYTSLERVIENDKAGYYKALMTAQRHRGTEKEDIGRWLYYLLNAIRQITERLAEDEQSLVEEPAVLYLNTRQRRVLDFVRREGELSVGEVDNLLPEVSRNTLKYDLKRLTEAGLLLQRGKGRGTVYTKVR
ncbi:MAG TPA: Fic family protein [Saprospiraceae bacterium]|nr:Fic family protein [Saprospiraceae bacterium]HMQ82060.1 Fic family protein [Saprospiraceae bacterium]